MVSVSRVYGVFGGGFRVGVSRVSRVSGASQGYRGFPGFAIPELALPGSALLGLALPGLALSRVSGVLRVIAFRGSAAQIKSRGRTNFPGPVVSK